jgi:hypothetical protein
VIITRRAEDCGGRRAGNSGEILQAKIGNESASSDTYVLEPHGAQTD